MQSKAKSNSVITTSIDEDGNIVFNVRGAGSLVLRMDQVSQECHNRAATHGWVQRISDAAALSRDAANGQPATPQAKYDAMSGLVEHYNGGATEWRLAGGGFAGQSGITYRAIAECRGITVEEAEGLVAKMAAARFEGDTKKCLGHIRNDAKYARKILEIRERELKESSFDADSALDELAA